MPPHKGQTRQFANLSFVMNSSMLVGSAHSEANIAFRRFCSAAVNLLISSKASLIVGVSSHSPQNLCIVAEYSYFHYFSTACCDRAFTYYLLCDDEFQQLPSAQMEEYLRADGHTLSRQTISNYLSCLEAANLICRGFDYLYYFAFGGYHKDTDEITYKRAWSEHWERIQQGWPSSESIVQMRMDYGGVARKHPLLIFSAFFNPMYGQIIDWALEAMNVDLGKSD